MFNLFNSRHPQTFPNIIAVKQKDLGKNFTQDPCSFNYVYIVWKAIIVNPTTFKVKTHSFNQNSHITSTQRFKLNTKAGAQM